MPEQVWSDKRPWFASDSGHHLKIKSMPTVETAAVSCGRGRALSVRPLLIDLRAPGPAACRAYRRLLSRSDPEFRNPAS
jgi:hypothetical protein